MGYELMEGNCLNAGIAFPDVMVSLVLEVLLSDERV